MAKWKLYRLQFGTEEFTLDEDTKISIGRGLDNKITLLSIVLSRNHCVIEAQKDRILITDLQSTYGTYIGSKKIPVGATLSAKHNDLIGFGWTTVVSSLSPITDNNKHVYKLVNENYNETAFSRKSTSNRIQYVCDSDDNLESNISSMYAEEVDAKELLSDKVKSRSKSLKRKSLDNIDAGSTKNKKEDNLTNSKLNNQILKKDEDLLKQSTNVINILSDSDSEGPTKDSNEISVYENPQQENTSYSQINPIIVLDSDEEFYDNLITGMSPPQPIESENEISSNITKDDISAKNKDICGEIIDKEDFLDDTMILYSPKTPTAHEDFEKGADRVDMFSTVQLRPEDLLKQSTNVINILSDSDSEGPTKDSNEISVYENPQKENTSYSQINPIIVLDSDEEFYDDLITILSPPQPKESENKITEDVISAFWGDN